MFLFLWLTHKTQHVLKKSYVRTDALLNQLNISNLNYFEFLIDAIHIRFPAFVSSNLKSYTLIETLVPSNTFMKTPSTYQFTSYPLNVSSFYGFYITAHTRLTQQGGGNIFKCQRSFISQLGVCDEIADCPDTHRPDEAGCVYNTNEENMQKRKQHTCSDVYLQVASGSCIQYIFALASKHHIGHSLDTRKTSTAILNLYEIQNKETVQLICKEGGKFPCTNGDLCFDLADLCNFKLVANAIQPCKTGEHLQNCINFQCNINHKCPDSFCIPWAYVCNGRWDCPHGSDEDVRCTFQRQCAGMFKCKLALICIHMHDICDDKYDCPLQDDELLCSLHTHSCPLACKCLAFAISCKNITAVNWHVTNKFPWHVIFVQNCTALVAKKILTCVQHIMTVVMTKNNLSSLCDLHLPLKHVVLVDVAHNKIHLLSKNCFQNLKYLKSVKVKRNNLSEVQAKTFNNITNLLMVDLSSNKLINLPSDFIFSSCTVQFLFLHNNSLLETADEMLQLSELKLFSTTLSILCCAVPKNTTCQAQAVCNLPCTQLLAKTAVKVLFCCVFVVLCFLSTSAAFIQRRKYQNQMKTGSNVRQIQKANNIVMNFFFFHDFVFAFSFGMLFTADQIFGQDFPLYQNRWKSNFFCYLIFLLNLHYHLVSPAILVPYCLSRLMVVMCPMTTRFKDPNFVGKVFAASTVISFVLSLFITSAAAGFYSQVSTTLCSFTVELCNSTVLIVSFRWILLTEQIISLKVAFISNMKLFVELKEAQKKVQSCKIQKSSDTLPIGQFVTVFGANLICWIPASVAYMVCGSNKACPVSISEWIAATIQPLISIVLPIAFIVMTKTSKQ